MEDRPFAKSTLQVFRAGLILHDKVREVFERSLKLARESGYLKGKRMKVALDTTNILGRGAVKDTYNLLSDGIVRLARALAQLRGISVGEWAKSQGYARYLASSVKGEAAIDWADRQARAALLAGIVEDADRLLELSRQAQGELAEDSAERQRIVAASELLGQLLLQDVERTEGGADLRDGVSRDRILSAHDPEMRHGHKSSSRRFDGHKAVLRSWSCPISCTRHSASFACQSAISFSAANSAGKRSLVRCGASQHCIVFVRIPSAPKRLSRTRLSSRSSVGDGSTILRSRRTQTRPS